MGGVFYQAKSLTFYVTRLIFYGSEFHVLLRYFLLQSSKNVFLSSMSVIIVYV